MVPSLDRGELAVPSTDTLEVMPELERVQPPHAKPASE
jgi:hypothetical protein